MLPSILFDFECNRVYITGFTSGCSRDKVEKSQLQESNSTKEASRGCYEC